MNPNLQQDPMLNSTVQLPVVKVKEIAGDNNSLLSKLWLLLFAGILSWLTVWIWQGIAKDANMRHDYAPIQAEVKGSCKSYVFIAASCSVDIFYQGQEHHNQFFFLDVFGGDYSVVPVRQITHPENVTIDLAIESLLSRTILALFLTALSILVVVAALRDILVEYPRMKRLIRMMNQGSCQLALYELDLEKCGQSNKIPYEITMNGKVFSFIYEMKNKKAYTNPILIKCNQSLYVLVIASLDNEAFLIVDEGLHRFALNKKSRKALREKIEQYINQP